MGGEGAHADAAGMKFDDEGQLALTTERHVVRFVQSRSDRAVGAVEREVPAAHTWDPPVAPRLVDARAESCAHLGDLGVAEPVARIDLVGVAEQFGRHLGERVADRATQECQRSLDRGQHRIRAGEYVPARQLDELMVDAELAQPLGERAALPDRNHGVARAVHEQDGRAVGLQHPLRGSGIGVPSH